MSIQKWQDLVAEKRRQQATAIPAQWVLPNPPPSNILNVIDVPETCGLLSEKEIEITNSHVADILQKLASGKWTAVEVTTAFGKRAVIAHQLVNCLTEIFIERALERAAQLDRHLKETGKVVGPLHGLPISLKDQINIKGVESTMGYVSWIGREITQNSVLADLLEEAGAVLYVKTNIPQTLMWPETFNHIFGRTRNPHNRSLTSGGSSGGEGALIALKGSPIGVGSHVIAHSNNPQSAIWGSGAAEDYAHATSPTQEPLIASMSLAVDDAELFKEQMVALGISISEAEHRVPPAFRKFPERVTAFDLWQTHKARRTIREEYLAHWNATAAITGTGRPVDAILSPAAPYTAPPHGFNKIAHYTMIWNSLDYTALIIPTGLSVDPDIDVKQPPHSFYSELDKDNYDIYNPKVLKDGPICVQLVGRTLEEEGVIALGEIVDAAIKAQSATEGGSKL